MVRKALSWLSGFSCMNSRSPWLWLGWWSLFDVKTVLTHGRCKNIKEISRAHLAVVNSCGVISKL
jgi:hypothetical protein